METIKRLKYISLLLGIFGFISGLFFSILAFGLGIGWEAAFKDTKISGLGPNIYQYMAGSFFIISICFLLFIAFLRMRDKVFLKTVALLPLIFVLLQCRILTNSKPDVLPDWVTEYSNWLEIILYVDFLFLSLTFILVILQFYLIRFVYRKQFIQAQTENHKQKFSSIKAG
jgi:hypothetical protein